MFHACAQESDSDWDRPKKRARKPRAAPKPRAERKPRAPRPPKAPCPPKEPKPQPQPGEVTESGRRRRCDAGAKGRKTPRRWTDSEEAAFLAGLEEHGRDWKAVAVAVGSRDARGVASHAQKHFIKLCLQGKRLPARVAASGEGYTLSGKPLDPDSAAARQYGFKPSSLAPEPGGEGSGGSVGADVLEVGGGEAHEPGAGGGAVAGDPAELRVWDGEPPPLGEAVRAVEEAGAGPGPSNAGVEPAPECRVQGAGQASPMVAIPEEEKRVPVRGTAPKPRERRRPAKSTLEPKVPAPPTEYARARPKRIAGPGPDTSQHFLGSLTNSLALQRPAVYPAGRQPLHLAVSREARLLMDFHSHLSRYEIMGYLGGIWDAAAGRLVATRAFPLRVLAGAEGFDSCEADPSSEVEVREAIKQAGLVCVGWYHSHPTFQPLPSAKDCDNQANYQALFRDASVGGATGGDSPFVGAIISPYDLRMPLPRSRIEYFHVRGGRPMALQASLPKTVASSAEDLVASCRAAAELLRGTLGQMCLTELWRPFERLEGKAPAGGPCTKLAKLRLSLAVHLEDGPEADATLDAIARAVQDAWGVDLGFL